MATGDGNQPTPPQPNPPRDLPKIAMIVAIVLLAIWLGFLVFMAFSASDAKPETWSRLAVLFASAEALAFAAGGALFGTTVQKARVQDAQKQAEQAQQGANNGNALAGAVRQFAAGKSAAAAGKGTLTADADVSELLAHANALFPESK